MMRWVIGAALLAIAAAVFFSWSTPVMENSAAPEESPIDTPAASDEKVQ